VHAEGAPRSLSNSQRPLRGVDPGDGLKVSLALAGVFFLAATSATSQEAQYFPEPSAKPKFSLRWDFLARYDRVDHREDYHASQRGRFELRPEIDFDPSEELRIGVRGVFDYGTDSDSYPEFDNFRSRGAALERYYVLWKPSRFTLRAGRFGMPLSGSEMLWDRDIQTPGAAASWESADGSWTLAAAGFYGPQRDGDRSRIGVGQMVWRTADTGRLQLEAAASYWAYDLRGLDAALIRENTPRSANGQAGYASPFHVVDLLVRLRISVAPFPIVLSLDGIHNFSALAKRRSAIEGTVAAGRVGTPGQARVFYTYQYVQRDAVVGAYNTDDWWFHSWYEGHRLGIAVTILPQTYVQASESLQRRLDTRHWINRYLVDVVKMF
jgi:hypothetical protein